MSIIEILSFNCEADASDWMYGTLVDDGESCIDNYRFAFADDAEAVAEYELAQEQGCCGSSDFEILINGHKAYIGCNYGH